MEEIRRAAVIILLILIGFFVYKMCLLKYYDTKEYEDTYKHFWTLYENKDEREIKYLSKDSETLNFKKLNFKNILGEYKIEEESDIHKVFTNGDKKIVVGSLNGVCKTEVFKSEEKVPILDFCKSEDIVNDLDFLKFMYSYKNKKINIFSSKNNIQKNWAFKETIFNLTSDNYKKLVILDGDITGYMFIADIGDDTVTDIFLINGAEEYFVSIKNFQEENFLESIYFS